MNIGPVYNVWLVLNNASVNSHVEVFMWVYVFYSLGYITKSREISRFYNNSMFNIFKNYKTVFQRDCIIFLKDYFLKSSILLKLFLTSHKLLCLCDILLNA